ncbi:hypothetical protein DFA_10740 [Cavenderia fasciculata]|uniref:RRM domain-containing protein n=1 Tax=Cavenderia fasciculata TaxID=261658 RepID=F4QB95_CACFS|nr:uncharacterized protein DFA_10740 [Cavenderia fasciculata]EGG14867.1 hypothetical protein DFA_10740 [Cavenderia fasciculata]|eukprot:XP_004351383.1 hypothetical protein DFA_10740 [Cavenderia fasciculata]
METLASFFHFIFGTLERCEIPENKFGKTRGFAFIEFENKDNAHLAFSQLSKQEIMLDGRVLKLEWAKATKLYKEDIQNLSGETRERFMGNFRNQNSLDSKFSKNKRKPQKRYPNSPGVPYETIAAAQNSQQSIPPQPLQTSPSQQPLQMQSIMPLTPYHQQQQQQQQQSNHIIQPPPSLGPQSSPNQMLNGHKLLNKSYSNVSPIGTSNGNMVANLYGAVTPTSNNSIQPNGSGGYTVQKKNGGGGMMVNGTMMNTGVSFDVVSNIQALNISPTQLSNKPIVYGLSTSNGSINTGNNNNGNGFIGSNIPTTQSNMVVGLALNTSNGSLNSMNHPSLGQNNNKSYLLDTSPILTANGITGINGNNNNNNNNNHLHLHNNNNSTNNNNNCSGNGVGGGLGLSSSSHSLSSSSSSTSSLSSSNNLTSPKPSPPTSSSNVHDFNSDFIKFTANPSAFQTTTIDFNPIPPISKLQHQNSQDLLPLPYSNNNNPASNNNSTGNGNGNHHLNLNPAAISMINNFGNNSSSNSSFHHHQQQQQQLHHHQQQISTDEKEHLYLKPTNFYNNVYKEPSLDVEMLFTCDLVGRILKCFRARLGIGAEVEITSKNAMRAASSTLGLYDKNASSLFKSPNHSTTMNKNTGKMAHHSLHRHNRRCSGRKANYIVNRLHRPNI